MKFVLFPIVILCLLIICTNQPNPTHPPSEPETVREFTRIEPGVFATDSSRITLVRNTSPDHPVWVMAYDSASGEALAVLSDRDMTTNRSVLTGVMYVAADYNAMTVLLNSDGLPDSILFSDSSFFTITDYAGTAATVSRYNPSGAIDTMFGFDFGKGLDSLRSYVATFGLEYVTSTGLPVRPLQKQAAVRGNFDTNGAYGWDVANLVIGGVFCATGFLTAATGVGAILAVTSCTSTLAGVLGMMASYAEWDNAALALNLASSGLGGISCLTLGKADCITFFMGIVSTLVGNCTPTEGQHRVVCESGKRSWYDDCGNKYSLIEECPCGCFGDTCMDIARCGDNLTLDVAITPDSYCIDTGGNIFFSSRVSGGDSLNYLYTWNFGDGSAHGITESVTHSFKQAGLYKVALVVDDGGGNYGYHAILVKVGGCDIVLAVLAETDKRCYDPGEAVSFYSLLQGEGTDPYSYRWEFGDGFSSTLEEPTHRYARAGIYFPVLEVTDYDGVKVHAVLKIKVGDCPVEVTILSDKACAEPDSSISFQASVYGGRKGTFTYLWKFGDGKTSRDSVPKHTYAKEGSYSVSLHVEDEQGLHAGDTISVEIGGCDSTPTLSPSLEGIDRLSWRCKVKRFIKETETGKSDTTKIDTSEIYRIINLTRQGTTFSGLWDTTDFLGHHVKTEVTIDVDSTFETILSFSFSEHYLYDPDKPHNYRDYQILFENVPVIDSLITDTRRVFGAYGDTTCSFISNMVYTERHHALGTDYYHNYDSQGFTCNNVASYLSIQMSE